MKQLISKINSLNRATVGLVLIADKGDLAIFKKFIYDKDHQLIYKSPDTPSNFSLRVQGIHSHTLLIKYGDHVYGKIIFCFKKENKLSKEVLILSEAAGNMLAQAITINWLLEKEQRTLAMAERQKETEVLLAQEKLKTEFIANATHE